MRSKLLILFAMVFVLSVVVAAPVSATNPVRGDQEMILNVAEDEIGDPIWLYGCESEFLSWFGEVIIDDTTYGMALYLVPDDPGKLTGNGTVNHYVEDWAIWSETFALYDGQISDCTPGELLMAGSDRGVWTLKTEKFRSNGTVDEAYGEFSEWLGRNVHQDGFTGLGDFEIFDINEGDYVTLEGVYGLVGDLRLN